MRPPQWQPYNWRWTSSGLDVLVNNAGCGLIAPFEQMSAQNFQGAVDTCFYGAVYTTRAALPVMREQKSGYIFQVPSVGGRHVVPAIRRSRGQVGAGWFQRLAGDGSRAVRGQGLHARAGRDSDQLGAARRSERAPDPPPDYEASVGSFLKILRGLKGHLESDPRKIADVLLQPANSDEVPVRLILGFDAERRVQHAEGARALEA